MAIEAEGCIEQKQSPVFAVYVHIEVVFQVIVEFCRSFFSAAMGNGYNMLKSNFCTCRNDPQQVTRTDIRFTNKSPP